MVRFALGKNCKAKNELVLINNVLDQSMNQSSESIGELLLTSLQRYYGNSGHRGSHSLSIINDIESVGVLCQRAPFSGTMASLTLNLEPLDGSVRKPCCVQTTKALKRVLSSLAPR